MIGDRLKKEFSAGHAPAFLIAAAPLSLALSFMAPKPFLPYITTLFFFPVYFHFVRHFKIRQTLFLTLLFGCLLFAILTAMTCFNESYMALRIPGGVAPELSAEHLDVDKLFPILLRHLTEIGYVTLLSAVSGGLLAMLIGVMALGGEAYQAGVLLASGATSAALLTISPWLLARAISHIIFSAIAAAIFYSLLERKPIDRRSLLRWFIWGTAFFVFAIYLEYSMSYSWNIAYRAALQGG